MRYRVASSISLSFRKDRGKVRDLIFLYIFKNVLIIALPVLLTLREGLEVIKCRTKTMKIRNVSAILIILLTVIRSAAQTSGCTDELAINYNSGATLYDGSCSYNQASVTPDESYLLDGKIPETSGLILWNGYLWTHNDNTDNNIYCLDIANGSLIKSYHLETVKNNDWEEISQDENYIYIGDFGNNRGDRQDLKIVRIEKSSLPIPTRQILLRVPIILILTVRHLLLQVTVSTFLQNNGLVKRPVFMLCQKIRVYILQD
jgi:hypothetical protein